MVARVLGPRLSLSAKLFFSSHHTSSSVPTSSTKIFFQGTPAEYNTLEACQDEYHPQEPQGTEGFGVQERAAEQSAIHPIRPPNGSSDHQGSTGKPQDQAS